MDEKMLGGPPQVKLCATLRSRRTILEKSLKCALLYKFWLYKERLGLNVYHHG